MKSFVGELIVNTYNWTIKYYCPLQVTTGEYYKRNILMEPTLKEPINYCFLERISTFDHKFSNR